MQAVCFWSRRSASGRRGKEKPIGFGETVSKGAYGRAGRIEILAPAGSIESLRAAVCAGADAVYIGGTRFGARAFAKIFVIHPPYGLSGIPNASARLGADFETSRPPFKKGCQ